MAKRKPGRLSQKTRGRGEKLSKRAEQSARPAEAILEEIEKTGRTPELEAELLDTPMLSQIQPQLLNNLVKEAGQQRDANLWRLLAKICERRNEDQAASTYATEALQIQPDDVASMGLLARLCEKRHADAEATDWHRRVLETDPTQAASNHSLAHFHYHRGEYETALQYLARLVELEAKTPINKLYWLLATVKSAGMLGLAQPLTDMRRWRNFTPEEEPLAHELFVLVGTQCLQSRQHTRAKQYLTRALQLSPTPKVEALLAEVSKQESAPTFSTNTTSSISPQVRQPPEPSSAVLRHDTQDRWTRVYAAATSGVGIITALVVVALFAVWGVFYTPEQRAFHGLQEEEMRSAEGGGNSSTAKQEVNSSASKLLAPQQQLANVPAPSLLPTTPSPTVAPAQPEAKKADPPPVLTKKPLNELAPSNTPMPEQKIAPTPVPAPAPKASILDPQLTAKKEPLQPTVPSQASEKTTDISTGDKEVRSQTASAVPNASKNVSPSLPPPVPSAADDLPDRKEQSATVSNRAPIREASTASNAITRLSAQLPYTTRFPIRERLVSVPPRQLLSTMKTLIKQETKANTVVSPARGVFRARVSGKRTNLRARPPRMYGQYIVEVTPGPTKGTSRVRAKALMFDWRTGQPIGNAGSLADRLLEKVGG